RMLMLAVRSEEQWHVLVGHGVCPDRSPVPALFQVEFLRVRHLPPRQCRSENALASNRVAVGKRLRWYRATASRHQFNEAGSSQMLVLLAHSVEHFGD